MNNSKADTRMTWQEIYLACTPKERDEITSTMLQRIESRRIDTIEYYKKMPLALESLPASKLMDVVEVALSDAHDWIVENFPQAKEKLSAYDSLTVFYMETGEKSERDLREVIGAICEAWEIDPITGKPINQGKPTATTKKG